MANIDTIKAVFWIDVLTALAVFWYIVITTLICLGG